MTLANGRIFDLTIVLLFLLATSSCAQLPYVPTRTFTSTRNGSLGYIFRPSNTGQIEFGSIDLTTSLGADPEIHTLYPLLPFADGDSTQGFVPAIDDNGNIRVYTGRCSDGASGAELWTFQPDEHDAQGNGTWAKESVQSSAGGSDAQLAGANHLASGISFSGVVDGTSSFYTFGGMCPYNGETQDAAAWQGEANYSNLLVTLTEDSGSTSYSLQAASTGSKPIAEAGFSLTGLAPSYSENSAGRKSMQQNFVMVGGHTQTAFINMSQVALFSLPQAAWNFLPIAQPVGGHTDLAIRDADASVEPRSGHSAVLSADGTKIIIFGGWLGSISSAATPQLAVLNVGSGYGGSGSWSWSIPDATGNEPVASYGHDAILLEGDVMMITGGYAIKSDVSRIRRRADGPLSMSTRNSFFNITSGAWMSTYTPPRSDSTTGADSVADKSGGALSSTSQKAGLGVGLGLGALAVICALIFLLWYRRRLRREREAREEEISNASQDIPRYTGDGRDAFIPGSDFYHDGPYNEKAMRPHSETSSQHGWRSSSGHDVERSGLDLEIPSPTRGLRRSLSGRTGYLPTPRYDDKRSSRASGNIPPIEESDEEHMGQSGAIESLQAYHQKKRSAASAFSNASTLDPFMDPLRSHPTSLLLPDKYEISTHPAHQIVAQGHLRNMEAEAKENGGRASPSKSERTSSTLSEATARSGMTARSTQSNVPSETLVGTIARNLSIRSSGLWNAIGLTATTVDPLRTPGESPTRTHGDYMSYSEDSDRPRTKESETTGSSHDTQSFHSARSGGFERLKMESEALLGDTAHDGRNANRFSSISYDNAARGVSPVRQDALPTPRGATFANGVFGSVRRALGAGTRRVTSTGLGSASFATRSPMFATRPRSGSTSPIKPKNAPLQRSVSDAGAWKARRSGAKDWLGDRYRYGEGWDDDPTQEEDWDVEQAANQRNVQVMFTVPRERLRVVNAEVDARSLLSSVDGEGLDERVKAEEDAMKTGHQGTRTL